jgi:acyl-CoA thioesterase-1
MALVKYASLFATLLILTACGGSSRKQQEKPLPPVEESPAPEAATPAPPRTEKPADWPVIVAYGDSLSAGFGVPTGDSYPDFLQQELDAAGYKYRVVNAGISGDTTIGGLERLNSVLDLKPKIAVLELGGNDGLRGLPLASTRDSLEKMIQGLQKADVEVALAGMTLPPNYGPDYIHKFEAIYVDLAAKYKLTRIPFLLEGVATNPKLMQPDGIHATTEGNRIVAKTVMRYLIPLLKQ